MRCGHGHFGHAESLATTGAKEPTRPPTPALLRYSVECLALASVAFVLQISFVPFDFQFAAAGPGLSDSLDHATTYANFPDIVANIFLYVPLGAFCHWTLKRKRGLRRWALPLSLMVAASLSATIEGCQVFSPSRVTSVVDLLCNTLGAAVGATLSGVAQRILPRWINATLVELRDNPRATVLKLYALLLVFCAALPFSFSLAPSQLTKSAKAAVLVPFATPDTHAQRAAHAGAPPDTYALSMLRWKRLKRWSRWAAECFSFGALAWFMVPLLRRDYGFSRGATFGLVWWLAGLFALGLSVLQFPIVSRGLDVTDVLFRLLGVGFGILSWTSFAGNGAFARPAQGAPHRRSRHAGASCAAVLAYIVYTGLLPLRFQFSEGRIDEALASPAFLPFMGYFVSRFDLVFGDVLEKSVAYAVFAALLATTWARIAGQSLARKAYLALPVCVAVSVMIEFIQVFLPVRVPSLTDPILAAVGCLMGIAAQEYGLELWRYGRRHEPLGPARRATGAERPSLTDQLIGSLIEPDPKAPRETAPAPRPTHRR